MDTSIGSYITRAENLQLKAYLEGDIRLELKLFDGEVVEEYEGVIGTDH